MEQITAYLCSVMVRLLKYLLIVMLWPNFVSEATGGNSYQPTETVVQVCNDFAQYQHSVYEPHSDFYVSGSNSSFSCSNPSRILKKNKRAGYNGRNCALSVLSRKNHPSGVLFAYTSKTLHFIPYLADTSHKLISLSKLII